MKCLINICNKKSVSKNIKICGAHYMQLRRHGKIITERIGFKYCRKLNKYTYTSYRAMLQRCSPKSQDYKYYKDIKICDRWNGHDGWDNFFDDMGERPKGLTLERINNYGNYEPENCKWASRYEQSQNTRKKINADNSPLKKRALENGIRYNSIWQRAHDRKCSLEDALDIMISNKLIKR